MTVLILVLLVLLTAAVLVLFAMLGELSGRLPDRAVAQPPQPLTDAPLGRAAGPLPAGFGSAPGLVLVLSTSCGSCEALAPRTAEFARTAPVRGVLVSSAAEETGREFADRHGLTGGLPVAVDVGGRCATESLGVTVSPAAVLTDAGGVIVAAAAFARFDGLREWAARSADRVGADRDGT